MVGSSDSARKKSSSSRELNTSRVSNINNNNNRKTVRDSNINRVLFSRTAGYNNAPNGSSGVVCEDDDDVDNDNDNGPFNRARGDWAEVSLREWLDRPDRPVDAPECLHVFRQVVEIVGSAHSQGIVVQNVKPSCFVMSSMNRVSFIESASCSDSGGSDSQEDGLSLSLTLSQLPLTSTIGGGDFLNVAGSSEASCMQSGSVGRVDLELDEKKQPFPMKQVLAMETNWYASPEESVGGPSSCSSDVYRLGVLLFELFCPSGSRDEKSRTMSSLRHRVLPPQLLLKWPKEASFCLWLLHPEPTCRPKMSELLQSEFLNEQRDDLEEREAAIELRERIEEQELLLDFLLLMQQRKQETADKLQDTLSFLTSDIEEVMKHQIVLKKKTGSCPDLTKLDKNITNIDGEEDDSASLGSRKRFRPGLRSLGIEECGDNIDGDNIEDEDSVLFRTSRLMKNFKKLEAAYFMTRCRPAKPPLGKPTVRNAPMSSEGRGSAVLTERSSVNNLAPKKDRFYEGRRTGWINPFLEGLCKYLSFSRLKVKADLKQGDLLNSSNLVCSLGFDRDGELFATAGVNKKIKVFECDTIMNEDRDIHYPVVEMSSRSKLSSICWNSYIKSQIASSNFEGVVQVWDVTRSQVQMEMREHEKRVWSIDFSSADPTLLASGSDDCSVKLWSINQGLSVGTIRTKANVCCVQFPMDSGRSIAFGSADHKIYYYDLRNAKAPLCTLVGHNKTVSYVKFVDSTTLVSASTDNTLKLWDLSSCSSRVIDAPLQTYTGHTNVKNFVGLSVSDGYITTGSETNEVFIYHKAFPMPALSFKFNNSDPNSGQEIDESSQFISSVCWRGQSNILVAANSTGNIKILEMV